MSRPSGALAALSSDRPAILMAAINIDKGLLGVGTSGGKRQKVVDLNKLMVGINRVPGNNGR